MKVVRYLDLALLALALPVFVLADLPLLGYAAAAVAWLVQRAIAEVANRRAARSTDPRTVVGLMTASMIGRGWLVALAIFGVGIGVGNSDGLAAAVLVIVLFTVYFTTQMIVRPFERPDVGP